MREKFMREVAAEGFPAGPSPGAPVTETELAALPETVKRYLRFMRVVGRPRVTSFCCRFTGRFRTSPHQRWQPCEAWSYLNGPAVARIFHMRMRLHGVVPIRVRDTYVRGRGRMRGRIFDLIPVVDGTGPEMDTGELVTYLNDAILLAPSVLLGPQTRWDAVDDTSFDVTLTDRARRVTARVVVDEHGAPLDFSTTDRFCRDPDRPHQGLTRARWCTPVEDWRRVEGHRLPTRAQAVWHLPAGPFAYADFQVDPESAVFDVRT